MELIGRDIQRTADGNGDRGAAGVKHAVAALLEMLLTVIVSVPPLRVSEIDVGSAIKAIAPT